MSFDYAWSCALAARDDKAAQEFATAALSVRVRFHYLTDAVDIEKKKWDTRRTLPSIHVVALTRCALLRSSPAAPRPCPRTRRFAAGRWSLGLWR